MRTDSACEAPPIAAKGRPAPEVRLLRTAFVTSRALDFCSQKELIAQTGHEPADWPLVVLKELLDNALDACEEAGIAPNVVVRADERGITVTDNGPGIPESTIRGITDFSVRVSSREAYVAPDRGKQGNSLKTILAMPFVLDGECGRVQITTGGVLYRIELRLDRVRSVPIITIAAPEELSNVRTGTSITVQWPDSACSILEEAEPRFLQMAQDAAIINPHLTLTVNWFGHVAMRAEASTRGWSKWKPNDPTSPHWYGVEHLARLIGAYIAHDAETGRRRTLREFVSEFRGLSGTAKQKAVAAACGLSGASLADLVVDGELDMALVEGLLSAMQSQSRPVKPQALGVLGRDHLARQFQMAGCEMTTFEYRKMEGTVEGVPWVVEGAFAAHVSAFDREPAERRFIAGINWSPTIGNPFRQLQPWYSLDSLLTEQRAGWDEPVVLVLHLACPRVEYTDRGKSAINLLPAVDKAVVDAITGITTKWCKTRKAEERQAASTARRMERMTRPQRRWTQVEAADAVMEKAYLAASANGTLPAHARQIMYQARGPMQEFLGKTLDKGFDQYFCQNLLPNYLANHPEQTEKWDVVFDARGHLTEPHTKRSVPLGTLQVRSYLSESARPSEHHAGWGDLDTGSYSTCGPRHRYSALLFIEKEGFTPLFEAVHLADRYDIAIMSTKGMSTTASRLLVERLCAEHDIRLLVVRDFDRSGFVIASTLSRSTRRYEFSDEHAVRVIDLGLRLEDVTTRDLPAEEVCYGKSDPTDNLIENGATAEEIAFLCRGYEHNRGGYWGERVELNAFTSDALVDWIEGKLDALRIKKVVPDETTLELAYRRSAEADYINRHTRKIATAARAHAARISLPDDLHDEVEDRLQQDRRIPWDQAVGEIVGEAEK